MIFTCFIFKYKSPFKKQKHWNLIYTWCYKALNGLPRVSLQFISSSGQCSIPSHQFSTGTQVWELGQIVLPGSQCLQIQEQSRVSWERKPEEQGGQTLGLQCATPSFIQRHSSQLSFIIVTFLENLEKYISKDFESRMTEFITERKVVEPAKFGSTISHSHQDKLEPAKEKYINLLCPVYSG